MSASFLVPLTDLDFSSYESEEERLQNDPQISKISWNRIILCPALSPPAQAGYKGHDEDGLKRELNSFPEMEGSNSNFQNFLF